MRGPTSGKKKRSTTVRRKKTPEAFERQKLAQRINYIHPENDLDFVASLEARRKQGQSEELDALNDIFHL